MKRLLSLTVVLFAGLSHLVAQDSTANAKIDSVLLYQKKMSVQQDKIYEEVVQYKEPLADKKFGVELNPGYLLVAASLSYTVLSGGVSLFDVDRKAEIALPFFVQHGVNKKTGGYQLTLWNQDIMYRRFLGQHQDGFYIEGGVRFTHIKGEMENGISLFGVSILGSSGSVVTTDKLGAMFGIGYRYFSSSGMYWGTSIVYGAYFSADERDIKNIWLDDTKTIFDIEILKFGIAF